MSIIRIRKEEKYSVIANSVLQDKNLTWEARGIMAYLLSKPDGWECRNYDIVNQGPAGKHVIQRVLKELQEAGYIHRYQKSDGHKLEWMTEIYETPALNTFFRNTDIPPAEDPTGGIPAGGESGDIVSTDDSKYLPSENTEIHMPQSCENDFSDLFDETEQPPTNNGKAQPQPLSEEDKAHLQTFGVLPGQVRPIEYAIRQEILSDGWSVYDPAVETGIVHYILAVREKYPDFALPKDDGTRKLWYKEVAGHLANYSLERLQSLYKEAIIIMQDNELSFWQPGSLTKWALPEAANAKKGGAVKNHTYKPDLTPEQIAALKQFRETGEIK